MFDCVEYTVQSGDTLGGIAELYYGEKDYYTNLARFNSLEDPDNIEVGQVLQIPFSFYTIEEVKCEDLNGKKTYGLDASRYSGSDITDSAAFYYAPGRDNGNGEYFIIEESDFDSFEAEVTEIDKLAVDIQTFRKSNESAEITEKTAERAKELEEKVAQTFNGLTKNPADAIQELLEIKSNPRTGKLSRRVYVRPYKIKNGEVKGHFRKNNNATVHKHLNKWLKKENEKGNKDGGMDTKLKAMIWQSDQLDTKWPWEFKTQKAEGSAETPVGYFSGSAEAQFFRFVAGAKAESEFDLSNMQIKLTASANASYSLAEGTVKGEWTLPDQDGFDMFKHLVLSVNARKAIKEGYECRFRLTTKAEGKAFVGAAITASVGLPCIDLSKNDELESGRNQTVGAGGSFSGFAGATMEGKIASCVEWDEQGGTSFKAIAEAGATAAGSAGIGAEGKFEIKYENGKIRFEAGIMAVLGLGGKTGCAFELSVDEGAELLAHLYSSIDFHRMDSVSLAAFEVMLNVSFAQFIIVGKVSDALLDKTKNFFGWLTNEKRNKEKFKFTKETIRKHVNDTKKLKASFPESMGQLLIAIMETPEEDDFDAILKVLQSADGNEHKMKWILRCVHDPKLSRDKGITDSKKGDALNAGMEAILKFGGWNKATNTAGPNAREQFLFDVIDIFKKNGINHNYQV